jgi:hypothetical protein
MSIQYLHQLITKIKTIMKNKNIFMRNSYHNQIKLEIMAANYNFTKIKDYKKIVKGKLMLSSFNNLI